MLKDTDTTAHILPIRVYYEDTDAGGIVYYANYMKYFERARTEWLRNLGISQKKLAHQENTIFVVKKSEIDYLKPAKLDDLIKIQSKIIHLGAASLVFLQKAELNETILCQSNTVVVCVNSKTMRPKKLNPTIRAILKKVQV